MERKREKISAKRRALLMVVGYLALALDKLEGKAIEPPRRVKSGRIKIVR